MEAVSGNCEPGGIVVTVRPQGEVTARFGLGHDRIAVRTEAGRTIAELLEQLGVPPGEVWICARNGVLAKRDDRLEGGDVLEIISPVSGGAMRAR